MSQSPTRTIKGIEVSMIWKSTSKIVSFSIRSIKKINSYHEYATVLLHPDAKDILISASVPLTLVNVNGVTLLQTLKAFSMAASVSAGARSGV